jgi:hypothetical protein
LNGPIIIKIPKYMHRDVLMTLLEKGYKNIQIIE